MIEPCNRGRHAATLSTQLIKCAWQMLYLCLVSRDKYVFESMTRYTICSLWLSGPCSVQKTLPTGSIPAAAGPPFGKRVGGLVIMPSQDGR